MADVELLPLPSPQVPFIDCDPSMTDIRRLVRWYEQGATEYARANVAVATAALRAEIDRLRTEAEQHLQQAMSNGAKARAAQAQADDLRTEVERLRAERDVLARENEAMKRCATKYLGWLGVTHMPLDEALREDMSDPTMCGDSAIAKATQRTTYD